MNKKIKVTLIAVCLTIIMVISGVLIKHGVDVQYDNSIAQYETETTNRYRLTTNDEYFDLVNAGVFENYHCDSSKLSFYDKQGNFIIETNSEIPAKTSPYKPYKLDKDGDIVIDIKTSNGKKYATTNYVFNQDGFDVDFSGFYFICTDGETLNYHSKSGQVVKGGTKFEATKIISIDQTSQDEIDICLVYARIMFWNDYPIIDACYWTSIKCVDGDLIKKIYQVYNAY